MRSDVGPRSRPASGNGVLLMPVNDPCGMLEAGLAAFESGFTPTREQPETQVRPKIAP
jgi:hypothetical protein